MKVAEWQESRGERDDHKRWLSRKYNLFWDTVLYGELVLG